MWVAVAVLCLAAASPPAFALDTNDAHWCRNGMFPSDASPIVVKQAKTAPRTYFRSDGGTADGCPDKQNCRSGYVLPGQEVLVSKRMGKFWCAYFPNSGGGTAGWIAESDLTDARAQPAGERPLSDWAGHWKDGEDEMTIRVVRDTLSAEGAAYWHGVDPSQVNDGEFSASAKPRNSEITFKDDSCQVRARLVGKYLVVSDNKQCGGMNVSFDGVYLEARASGPH